MVNGWETVGNSLGRAPLGGSHIVESRAVGTGFHKFHQCDCPEKLRAQDFSSGLQTLGEATCIAALAGSDTKKCTAVGTGFSGQISSLPLSRKTVRPRPAKVSKPGHGTCIASLAGSKTKRAELLAWIFHDKFHQRDCPEKLVSKTSQTVSKRWAKDKGTCRTCMGKSSLLEGFSYCTAFCPSMLGFRSLGSEAN